MQASGLFTSSVKTRLTDRIVGDVDSLLLNVRATDAHTVTRFGPARCLNWSTSSAGLRMRLQTLGQSQEVGNAHKMNKTRGPWVLLLQKMVSTRAKQVYSFSRVADACQSQFEFGRKGGLGIYICYVE